MKSQEVKQLDVAAKNIFHQHPTYWLSKLFAIFSFILVA